MITSSEPMDHVHQPSDAWRSERTRWSWAEALATAEPGRRYRVSRVLFDLVRNRCRELGFREGDEVTCTSNDGEGVVLQCRTTRGARIEREYAWFIKVEQV